MKHVSWWVLIIAIVLATLLLKIYIHNRSTNLLYRNQRLKAEKEHYTLEKHKGRIALFNTKQNAINAYFQQARASLKPLRLTHMVQLTSSTEEKK